MNRRNFLSLSLLAGMASLLPGSMVNYESAHQTYERFPEELPGVSVEKYQASEVDKVFVHVRQIHSTGYLSTHGYFNKTLTPEGVAKVVKKSRDLATRVHHELYDALMELQNNCPFETVYNEGLGPDQEEQENNLDIIILKKEIEEVKQEVFGGRRDLIGRFFYLEENLYRHENQVAWKLKNQGAIRWVKGASTRKSEGLSKKAAEKYSKGEISREEYLNSVLEVRENSVVKLVEDDNSILNIIIFGGDHDFYNNLTNSEQNIGLITLTPNSYEEIKEEFKESLKDISAKFSL